MVEPRPKSAGDPATKRVRLTPRALWPDQSDTLKGRPVILLSFFDGIATARLILDKLQVTVEHFWAWENFPDCVTIASHHWPEVQHQGDLMQACPKAIAAAVQALPAFADSEILITAGPPCPDYSRIRDSAPGRTGPEGKKFDMFCDFLVAFEDAIPKQRTILIENVIPKNRPDAEHSPSASADRIAQQQ